MTIDQVTPAPATRFHQTQEWKALWLANVATHIVARVTIAELSWPCRSIDMQRFYLSLWGESSAILAATSSRGAAKC
jgi:hypothetical protein